MESQLLNIDLIEPRLGVRKLETSADCSFTSLANMYSKLMAFVVSRPLRSTGGKLHMQSANIPSRLPFSTTPTPRFTCTVLMFPFMSFHGVMFVVIVSLGAGIWVSGLK